MPDSPADIRPDVWQSALAAQAQSAVESAPQPATAVLELVAFRNQAYFRKSLVFRGVNKPINHGYCETLKQFGADGIVTVGIFAPNCTSCVGSWGLTAVPRLDASADGTLPGRHAGCS